MLTLEHVYEFFPEIRGIEDHALQEKVSAMWLHALNENEWTEDLLRRSPIDMDNLSHPGNNLDHVRDVAVLAMEMYDYMRNKYGMQHIGADRDTVLAAALCHDIGKMYEYRVDETGPHFSDDAHLLRHPLKGAILAAEYGLPKEVIHAIATHSWEGDRSHRSLISYIIRSADNAAYQMLNF